jgi:hypothetical protein
MPVSQELGRMWRPKLDASRRRTRMCALRWLATPSVRIASTAELHLRLNEAAERFDGSQQVVRSEPQASSGLTHS